MMMTMMIMIIIVIVIVIVVVSLIIIIIIIIIAIIILVSFSTHKIQPSGQRSTPFATLLEAPFSAGLYHKEQKKKSVSQLVVGGVINQRLGFTS